MGLATYSPEGRIKNGLRELNCAESNFAKIAAIVGKTRLMEGLAGENDFDNSTAEQLLSVLNEMKELQAEIDAPLDWSKVDRIQTALVVRRVARVAAEMNDHGFDSLALQATKGVVDGID